MGHAQVVVEYFYTHGETKQSNISILKKEILKTERDCETVMR